MGRARTIARRSFLIGSAAILGGIAFGAYKLEQEPENPLRPGKGETTLNPYLLIDGQGITIITPRAEMGQGNQTTLAALVAEELDLAWGSFRIMHGPPAAAYANSTLLTAGLPVKDYEERSSIQQMFEGILKKVPTLLALQATGGSSAMPDAFVKMRLVGAAARQVLMAAAARKWNVPVGTLSTRDGVVHEPGGRRASYVELAPLAVDIEPPANPPLKPASQWRYLGKSVPRLDQVAKVTGTAAYGIDTRLDGMLYATIRINPRLGGEMLSFDASEAEKMPGVRKIVDLGNGVGVIATNTWLAFQAVQAIQVEWGAAPYPPETDAIMARIEQAFEEAPNSSLRNDGDTEAAFSAPAPDDVVEAEYRAPFLAHTTMEPMNATALYTRDSMRVWVGNQSPVINRDKAAEAVGLPSKAVELITPFLGGGFGRRSEYDFTRYAALMAKAMPGTPVKTTWRREEDITHDYYRPAAIARFRAVMGKDGPVALEGKIAAPSVTRQSSLRLAGFAPPGPDRGLVEGAFDQPYGIADYRVDGHFANLDIPIGFWRSVGNSYNGFFHESFMDEMAHARGLDPVKMRLRLMKGVHEPSRLVLEKVATMAGWTGKTPEGIGRGVAFTYSFGAPTAEIIEVRDGPDGIRITRAWAATDVGVALDPRNIRAQIMSGIIYGLSAAVMGEITFSDGMVEQENFPDYDALRMNNAPRIDVEVLENKTRISGIGEPGTPPSMPALANALFDLTGKRARNLPLNAMFDFA
ncbi:MAG: xanthine dehydrogenase family protein molybdopterin-binding subunit [Paracoccaceae bacterium]|nr:xanthine dehydrogenase family protein molybdopterin-binding subunit [Paracoccaceae bacterium]